MPDDGIRFDFSDLTHLVADLGKVPETAGKNIVQALQVTSVKMKKSWREHAKDSNPGGRLKAYPYSIDFELTNNAEFAGGAASELTSTIGPNLGRAQGALGIVEESPGGVRGRPQGNARKAVAENASDFEKGILIAAADALGKPR